MDELAPQTEIQLAQHAAQTVVRTSYGKLIAILAKRTRDVAQAEDLLAEAFATALETWPCAGVPNNPEAWLITVAQRKFLDSLRQVKVQVGSMRHLQLLKEELEDMASQTHHLGDDRLALMFACAHPAIDPAIRSPLILQTVLGMTAEQIASSYLIPAATMGQRLARAKAKIKLAGIPFQVPSADEFAGRFEAVLDAIYAMFDHAWSHYDAGGNGLAEDALWFASLLIELQPDQPEPLGLSALILYLHARLRARRDAQGNFIPLADQDVNLWNSEMIDQAEHLLRRASAMNKIGRFQLEAAVQSVHTTRRFTGATDWKAINKLYHVLYEITGSAVVQLNLAYSIGEDEGWEMGLAALPELAAFPELASYQPYFAVRAALREKCGQSVGALEDYERAIQIETDQTVINFLAGKCQRLRAVLLQ